MTVPPEVIRRGIESALAEDIGSGDATASLIPADRLTSATVISREAAVICGQAWFEATFHALDPVIRIEWFVAEGASVAAGTCLCRLDGPARAILSGERTALNFLQTLSATATATRRFVDAVAGTRTRILDTRKTIPGLRLAQKYAVTCGGGTNHRLGLYDRVLIKENHILACGSIPAAVASARELHPDLKVEVETETLAEVETALSAGADIIMLDDFDLAAMREAVALVAGRAEVEASGGIGLHNVRAVAETGVDSISLGTLTKDIRAIDLSMRFDT